MAGSIVARPGIRLITALLIALGLLFAGIGTAEGAKRKVKMKVKVTKVTEEGVGGKLKANAKGKVPKKVEKKVEKKCVKKREVVLEYLPPPLPTRAHAGAHRDDDKGVELASTLTNRVGSWPADKLRHNLPASAWGDGAASFTLTVGGKTVTISDDEWRCLPGSKQFVPADSLRGARQVVPGLD